MTKKILCLLGIFLAIIIGTFLYCDTCCDSCSLMLDGSGTTATGPLYIKDEDGTFEYTSNDNFNFTHSDYEILTPVSYEVEDGVSKLFAYLGVYPSKIIDITGYYSSDETNNSAFPNLGFARAAALKNYLVSKGISSKQINIKGRLKDDLENKNGTLFGPLGFRVRTPSKLFLIKQEQDVKALRDKLKESPIILYFEPAQAKIDLTEKQRQEIADISVYLDKVDGAVCIITGHTDNTGGRATNMRLGQNRADFVKNYLIRNGIPPEKINATSEGPDSPIADNSTEDGRAENRRTVITIN
ncbi:OmpA family protein [Abyssalbus ytuae]|uniref:OmpA family protein n=1 Tax=Abyssalbus ytuae TaxID=2926907 RepID=A0A9E7A3I3_9FLAO|nr:OmpA family protein [Abyssalbus ytuae]UOB19206.1 OmpA family protein [Abyssalbus ytuae]